MYEPGHNEDFYKKAKQEMAELYPPKDSGKGKAHRVWVPSVRQASGIRFGYWRYVKG